eukprot:118900_1
MSHRHSHSTTTATGKYEEDSGLKEKNFVASFWKHELLIFGYIRDAISILVPQDVVNIIHKFWLSDDDDISGVIFGRDVVDCGIFKWNIQINKLPQKTNEYDPIVGIIQDSTKNLTDYSIDTWDEQCIGYRYCGNGYFTDIDGDGGYHHIEFNYIGDILQIVLNMDEFTIDFSINGEECVTFSNIETSQYRLAIIATNGFQFTLFQ